MARIGKAFTTLWTGHVEIKADTIDPTLAMPFAVNDAADAIIMRRLICDAGFVPVEIGDLAASAPLDPGSSDWNVVLSADEVIKRVTAFRAAVAA